MPLELIIDVTNPERRGLLAGFDSVGVGAVPDFVRNDRELPIVVRPVVPSDSANAPWADDHETGDTYRVCIGNPDEQADGGTFTLTIDGETTSDLAYDITAAELQTALSAKSIAGGNPAVIVTELTEGAFQIDGATVGVLPLISGDATSLLPVCGILVNRIANGSASTKGRQIIQIYREPVANDYPSTAEPNGEGVSGTLNLNTENLLKEFSQTREKVLGFYLAVIRTRATDEEKTILQVPVRLHRDIVDVGTLTALSTGQTLSYVEMEFTGDALAGGIIGSWSPIIFTNVVGIELWARQVDDITDTRVDLYVGATRQFKTATLPAGEQYARTTYDAPFEVDADTIITARFVNIGDPPAGYVHARLICVNGVTSVPTSTSPDGVILSSDGSYITDSDGDYIAFS